MKRKIPSNNLKILLVIPTYLPILGGAELAVHKIAKFLISKGYTADVLTFNIKTKRWKTKFLTEIDYIEGIKVVRIGAFNPLFFLNNSKYKSLFMRIIGVQLIPSLKLLYFVRQYDIIHFNDEVNLSIPFFLILNNRVRVFHIRTLIQLYKYFEKNIILKLMLRNCSEKFIIESEKYIALLNNLGINNKRMIRWKKGVDCNFFYNTGKRDDNNVLKIIFVSARLNDSNKGAHILLKAIKKIKKNFELIIVTKIQPENEYSRSILNEIKVLITKDKKSIKVHDSVTQEKLLEFYNHAHIFVFPPLKDSMPNVLLEASACELPAISTNVGGIPEIVVDGETGYLVDPGDVDSLHLKIEELLSNSHLRKQFGKNAREHVMKNYSMEKSIDNLIEIYKRL